jgi:hypothetical protein
MGCVGVVEKRRSEKSGNVEDQPEASKDEQTILPAGCGSGAKGVLMSGRCDREGLINHERRCTFRINGFGG